MTNEHKNATQPSAQQAEPVAWEFSSPAGEKTALAFLTSKPDTMEHYKAQGWSVLPLYAAPAPSASPAAPKPMTDEDLGNLYWVSTGQSLRERDKRLAFAFGRAVESGVRRAVAEAQTSASPAALTDAQMAAQDARFAIDGAIGYGRMGVNPPPEGHWLTEYWAIGQQLAELGKTSAWDNQTPVDSKDGSVKFARYEAMEEAGRQASEKMRQLERYLDETSHKSRAAVLAASPADQVEDARDD